MWWEENENCVTFTHSSVNTARETLYLTWDQQWKQVWWLRITLFKIQQIERSAVLIILKGNQCAGFPSRPNCRRNVSCPRWTSSRHFATALMMKCIFQWNCYTKGKCPQSTVNHNPDVPKLPRCLWLLLQHSVGKGTDMLTSHHTAISHQLQANCGHLDPG